MNAPHGLIAVAFCLASAAPVAALDYVTLKRDGESIYLAGQVVIEAEDGGLLLLAPDSVLWRVQPDEIVKRDRDEKEFALLNREQITEQLSAELPDGFKIHHTAHYVICYNTSDAYAQWCGALYERLFRGFYGYWNNRGWKLEEPATPLVALVFDSEKAYAEYARPELGGSTGSIIGYYSLNTNRVVSYDLTGVEQFSREDKPRTAAHINLLLSRAGAERTVATIVHEATHQLAFNSGMQARYADIPLWLSEGIAIFFETPDLKSSKGWRTIGGVNQFNLKQLQRYFVDRPADSLPTLLVDDKRLRDPETRLDSYAEAWALTYFLMRSRPRQFVEYLKLLAEKDPFVFDEPEERLAQFQAIFGEDLESLDTEFVRSMRAIRVRN